MSKAKHDEAENRSSVSLDTPTVQNISRTFPDRHEKIGDVEFIEAMLCLSFQQIAVNLVFVELKMLSCRELAILSLARMSNWKQPYLSWQQHDLSWISDSCLYCERQASENLPK